MGHVGVEVGRVGCVMWGGGVGHTGVGGVGDSWVNGENNRCYSYLSLDLE